MSQVLSGLLVSNYSRITRRPLYGVLKDIQKHRTGFVGWSCSNRWNSTTFNKKGHLDHRKASVEAPCAGRDMQCQHSRTGNALLEKYFHSVRKFRQIKRTMIKLNNSMQKGGIPFNVNSIHYEMFMDDVTHNIGKFTADELLFLTNLHLNTNTANFLWDKTKVLLAVLTSKLGDLSITEIFQLSEMLIVSNVQAFLYMRLGIQVTFENKIKNESWSEEDFATNITPGLRLCAFMPISNTNLFLSQIIRRNTLPAHLMYSNIMKSFNFEDMNIYLRGELYAHMKDNQCYSVQDYGALEIALDIVYAGLLENSAMLSIEFMTMLLQIMKDWSFLLPFFANDNFTKNITKKIAVNITDNIVKESFYSEINLIYCNSSNKQQKLLQSFLVNFKCGQYDEDMVNDLITVLNKQPMPLDNMTKCLHVLAVMNNDNLININQYINDQTLKYAIKHIDKIYDLLYLNLDEDRVSSLITENLVANNITTSSLEEWKNNFQISCIKELALYLYKVCLLSVAMQTKAPCTTYTLPICLSPLIQMANTRLFSEYARYHETVNMDMMNIIFPENYIPHVVYKDVGMIDALIVLDHNGFPRNVAAVTEHRNDFSYQSLNLDNRDIRIAVLNIGRDDCVIMNSTHLRRVKKCLEEYLTSEGFAVVLDYTFLPMLQREARLRRQLFQSGMK